MKVEEYQFSSEEIVKLKKYRDEQPDACLQRRFLSLIMLAEGVNIEFVMKVFDISHRTLQRCVRQLYSDRNRKSQFLSVSTQENFSQSSRGITTEGLGEKKALETEP